MAKVNIEVLFDFLTAGDFDLDFLTDDQFRSLNILAGRLLTILRKSESP